MLIEQSSLEFIERDENIVERTVLWDLGLYPRLFKLSEEFPQPYTYRIGSLRMITILDNETSIPVCIEENSHSNGVSIRFVPSINVSQRALLKEIERVCCINTDLQAFYDAVSINPTLNSVVHCLWGLRPMVSMTPFEGLIRSVIRQLIRAVTARQIVGRLTKNLGQNIILNKLSIYSFPTPQALLMATPSMLKKIGFGYKMDLVLELARDVSRGELDLETLAGAEEEEIVKTLTSYNGIGSWTAKAFAADGLGRLDLYPIQDINLRKSISNLFYKGCDISWETVESFIDRYDSYKGILIFYLMAYLWLSR